MRLQPERREVNRPLRIGYVVKRFPRVSETFIAQEILELERRGAEVRILTLGPNDQPAQHAWLERLLAGVLQMSLSFPEAWAELAVRYREPVSRGNAARTLLAALADPHERGRRGLAQAVEIARLAESEKIDHLHAHFANQPATTALLAHQLCGVSFSFTAHAKDIWTNPATARDWRRLARAASFVVTVSDMTHRHVTELVGQTLSGRIRRLYNGIDVETIRPRALMPVAEAPLRLLCVARLVEKKGVDVLLDACAALRGAQVPFSLDIIGDGELAPQLRCRSIELGLEDSVTFRGARPHEDVVAAMATCDAFVLPCRIAADGDMDTLPTALLEAMACGVPCISTPIAGVAEIIADGETGCLVPPGDAPQLAAAIARLRHDPAARLRMGRAARRRAERLFDIRKNVAVLHDWFEQAALGSQTGSPMQAERHFA
jgi:colanic acid/amylovoran biosynthesis glycosyltransferase